MNKLDGLGLDYSKTIDRINRQFPKLQTPFLYFDESTLANNYARLLGCIKESDLNAGIYFSVKANNHDKVISSMAGAGSGFDAASIYEINQLIRLGVLPDRITFSTTVKIPSHIVDAYKLGVRLFAADSYNELEKISRFAPGSKVFIRIAVSNQGSLWPLINKFGCTENECILLLKQAKELKLRPVGVAFHVGSQCMRVKTWIDALDKVKFISDNAKKEGIDLELINMGGGFPAKYVDGAPTIQEIINAISKKIKENFSNNIHIMFEPGRHIVANAAVMVASVIGTAIRFNKNWAYLDLSIYSGLLEAVEKWDYTIYSNSKSLNILEYVIAGPTCDSTDIVSFCQYLPEIHLEDRVYIFTAGAYTNSYDRYNGIPFPQFIFLSANKQ